MAFFMMPPDGKFFERISDPKEIKQLQEKGWTIHRKKEAKIIAHIVTSSII